MAYPYLLLRVLFLACRAVKRRSPVLHDSFDDATAAGCAALLAFTIVNTKVVLEHAKLAIGELVIAQARTAVFDRLVEHRFDAFDQPFRTLVRRAAAIGNGRCEAEWLKPGAVQRLAD